MAKTPSLKKDGMCGMKRMRSYWPVREKGADPGLSLGVAELDVFQR